jgi:hypothetical protein
VSRIKVFASGTPLALDAAERAVDEVGPDLALALVKAPVEEVLEDQHAQDHRGRGPRAAAARTLRRAPRQRLNHQVHESLVVQLGVDALENGVPQLLAIRQEHLDEAPLRMRATDHRFSGERDGREPQGLRPASPDIGPDHHPICRLKSTKMQVRSSSDPAGPPLARRSGASSAPGSS